MNSLLPNDYQQQLKEKLNVDRIYKLFPETEERWVKLFDRLLKEGWSEQAIDEVLIRQMVENLDFLQNFKWKPSAK